VDYRTRLDAKNGPVAEHDRANERDSPLKE
jgi:hypothetical protein